MVKLLVTGAAVMALATAALLSLTSSSHAQEATATPAASVTPAASTTPAITSTPVSGGAQQTPAATTTRVAGGAALPSTGDGSSAGNGRYGMLVFGLIALAIVGGAGALASATRRR